MDPNGFVFGAHVRWSSISHPEFWATSKKFRGNTIPFKSWFGRIIGYFYDVNFGGWVDSTETNNHVVYNKLRHFVYVFKNLGG